jgi:transcriptional regulator with XRE-family HTH domain
MQTEKLQIKIGKKLKELRTVNQWTQEQIAGQLHLTRNAYSDIELGKTDICISRLAQLANFFSVDISYFVDDKERVVIYLAGTQNIQSVKNQKIKDCHIYPSEEKLQYELEKQQLQLDLKDKELALQQREIENLKEIIALLKNQPQ